MPGKQSLDLIKMLTERIKISETFDRALQKVKILSIGNGKCQAEFKVLPEYQNEGETLHGGFSATLVDCISTYALMTHGKQTPGVSVDLHMKYMKPAFSGDEILIDARTIRAGKYLAFLEVTLTNKATGDIVVSGSHTKYIGDRK